LCHHLDCLDSLVAKNVIDTDCAVHCCVNIAHKWRCGRLTCCKCLAKAKILIGQSIIVLAPNLMSWKRPMEAIAVCARFGIECGKTNVSQVVDCRRTTDKCVYSRLAVIDVIN